MHRMKIKIDGYDVVVMRQAMGAPWVTLATRKRNGKIEGFNAEGTTKARAIDLCKQRIKRRLIPCP